MKKIFSILIIFSLSSSYALAASFDCNKARTATEKEICSNKELSNLDDKLQSLYRQALAIVPYKEELKKQQIQWLKKRDKTEYIEFRYQERIAEFTSTIKAHELAGLRAKEQNAPASKDRIAALVKKRFLTKEEERELLVLVAQQRKIDKGFFSLPHEKKELKLCSSMLEDIQRGRKFEIISPIARTDDYNDPSLQQYLGKCSTYTPPYKDISYFVTDPHVHTPQVPDDDIESGDIPVIGAIGTIHYALLDYRLYLVDFDNNPKNGKEYVFYRGGKISKGYELKTGEADFVVMDRNTCKQRSTEFLVNLDIDFRTGEAEGSSGMFSYGDRYYMYSISYSKKENFLKLRIFDYNARLKRTIGLCATKDK